eukprot:1143893-Pelagomonas_calceolata.AAC.10
MPHAHALTPMLHALRSMCARTRTDTHAARTEGHAARTRTEEHVRTDARTRTEEHARTDACTRTAEQAPPGKPPQTWVLPELTPASTPETNWPKVKRQAGPQSLCALPATLRAYRAGRAGPLPGPAS